MRIFLSILCLSVCFLLFPRGGFAVNTQIVAGAGPSTEVATLFFASFSKEPVCQGYKFSIMEKSIKHKGGIRSSDNFLFGRTGRPLNAAEKALGKDEILLGEVPIIFAVGLGTQIKSINLDQLESIFTRKITNWNQLGGINAPIILVGRESSEALFCALIEEYPYFKNLSFDKVFNKDHEVVKFLKTHGGSTAISFGAKPNFPKHNLLKVDGLLAASAIGLVYDLKNKDLPVVKAAAAYADSSAWKKQLEALDLLLVK